MIIFIMLKVNLFLLAALIGTVIEWIDRSFSRKRVQKQRTNVNSIYISNIYDVYEALENVRIDI